MQKITPRISAAEGMTIVELLLGVLILSIAGLGIVAAYISQATLNEHAYNLTRAGNDAVRIMEQIRLQNSGGCALPSAETDGGWDDWMDEQDPGKSVLIADADTNQLVVVTCQDEDGGNAASDLCGPNQISSDEWASAGADSDFDPIRVTVSICWAHRGRVYGECSFDGGVLAADDLDGDGSISSPASLMTLVTCRD